MKTFSKILLGIWLFGFIAAIYVDFGPGQAATIPGSAATFLYLFLLTPVLLAFVGVAWLIIYLISYLRKK